MLRKIKQNKKNFRSVSDRNRFFWGSPQFSLSPDPPLTFFKKLNVSLVGGEATEHVNPKKLCLAPIGAEISQVRFDAKKIGKTLKTCGVQTTLCFPAEISFVSIIAAFKRHNYAQIDDLKRTVIFFRAWHRATIFQNRNCAFRRREG